MREDGLDPLAHVKEVVQCADECGPQDGEHGSEKEAGIRELVMGPEPHHAHGDEDAAEEAYQDADAPHLGYLWLVGLVHVLADHPVGPHGPDDGGMIRNVTMTDVRNPARRASIIGYLVSWAIYTTERTPHIYWFSLESYERPQDAAGSCAAWRAKKRRDAGESLNALRQVRALLEGR